MDYRDDQLVDPRMFRAFCMRYILNLFKFIRIIVGEKVEITLLLVQKAHKMVSGLISVNMPESMASGQNNTKKSEKWKSHGLWFNSSL